MTNKELNIILQFLDYLVCREGTSAQTASEAVKAYQEYKRENYKDSRPTNPQTFLDKGESL